MPEAEVRVRPVRDERDLLAVREVHTLAFGRVEEARLVLRLHAAEAAPVSLLAACGDRAVGHGLFSPASVEGSGTRVVGLAPLGVLPAFQGRGVGSAIVRAGLGACREAGFVAVVVLGEPVFYARFGFERASERGLGNEYGADREFMALELVPGGLDGVRGTVRYRPEFGWM
ncbi:putative acetyltransferase [Rubrobacter radiotolerans]|uniref:N-acetyltransferase n=1 Tax=Rubrobacter radiotolerans TaxID=42256 RepID=A0A023X603_RUBRA|nr:N-acetyltransferase [Rubrobacter radiotolerans]AHY47616.1 putative acetyltransferase [Rubrobacter radiotolerans]MDX5895021.1 N-acetyltransferase [Rubrobacter radiotolerans]SMC07288.1 putative acetyltransferase [Rubrobacter radiotolerans DSM 5868]